MAPDPWSRPPNNEKPNGSRLRLYVWIGCIVVGGLCLWQLDRIFPRQRSDYDNAFLIRNVAILAVISSSVIFARRFNFTEVTRNIALWVGVCAVIALGYVYQDELKDAGLRIRSEIVPGYAVTTSAQEMVLTESGGHFIVIGQVNGVAVTFLIDTGASDIVLSPRDAKRTGIDLTTLDYSRIASTANGTVRGAPANVSSLQINQIALSDVPITVNQADMDTSLLGMAFLRRLKSYEVRGRQLYLRW